MERDLTIDNKNKKEENVVIFINTYNKERRKKLTTMWEDSLYNECKRKKYKIVTELRYDRKISITELYEDIKQAYKIQHFSKILVFDFREICLNALKLIGITEMLKDLGIEIEILYSDHLLSKILHENIILESYLVPDYRGSNFDLSCFFDDDDYYKFMEELEYTRSMKIIRLDNE